MKIFIEFLVYGQAYYNIVPKDAIFDKRNIEIERQLTEIYGTDKFNYSVWHKNELHNVYTYFNGTPYEYEYFIKDGFLELEEVTNKTYKR